ncbi:MAG: hypothetical protein MJ109_05750 [Kiritimatiellae bacterium]|nr:hypothetical protein [Kiritimatiellia bacterium]
MIVKMKHLDLLSVATEGEATLKALRDLGAVHLDLGSATGLGVQKAKGEIEDAEKAYRFILKCRENLEGTIGVETLSVEEILELASSIDTLKSEKDRLERLIKEYAPYGDFDPVLAKSLIEKGIDLSSVAELPKKLPEVRLSKMESSLAEVNAKIASLTLEIAKADEKKIEEKFPSLKDSMAFEAAKELLTAKGSVALVSGWIPATKVEALKSAATVNGWGLLVRDVAEGEVPPTLIEPPKFFKSVKALFDGLGIAPGYTEADVSVPFMCYFSLFFAMLVGDGGYGAIFLAATLWAWKKFGTSPWVKLLTVFSTGTIIWGLLSNTWFGAGIPWCADWPTVKWLGGVGAEQGHEYDNMMFLCFTIGVTHLMLARIWNGICQINSRSCLSQFGWAGIVLFMYLVTNSIVGIFSGIPTWAFWMFGISFLTVFIQSKGIDKGMLFLNAMSVLGDIISYVRLFAVGLASVKVAENFNMMAVDLGLPIWIKWLPLVLILLVGHGLNLAMAGLSILVHAVRLNTLEFSNHKGISWSGYQFKPFNKTEK